MIRDQKAIADRAYRLREREEVYSRLAKHIASCGPCCAVGGLDAKEPSLSLCPRGVALLAVWDGLGASP